jgi:hypothetical protein
MTESGQLGRRYTALLLVAIFATLVGFRLFLARGMEVPTLYSDEMGYFANARFMAGQGGPLFAPRSPSVSFGYSLLITPLYWLFDEPLEVFRWALRVNAVIASAHLFVLYVLARSLVGLARRGAVWAAALASLYPPLLVHSNFAWSENVLPMLFTTWVLAATACWRRRTAGATALLALVCGVLYATHARTLPLVVVAVGCLLFLGWRRLLGWSSVLGAVALLGGLLAITVALNGFLHESMWGLDRLEPSARITRKVTRPLVWLEFPLAAAGQTWYLMASTLGLAALGAGRLTRQAVAPTPAEAKDGRHFGATIALVGALALFGLSVVFCAGGRRIDQLVYGRYNEIFVPVLVVVFLAWLYTEGAARMDRLLVAGSSALAIGAVVTFVRVGNAYDGPFMPLTVMGVLPFQTTVETLDFPAISLASAGCALALGVLLKWRVEAGLVALSAACLLAAVRIDREFVAPIAEGFPRVYTLQHQIDRLPPDEPVAYDIATADRMSVNAYQFHLLPRGAILFDSEQEAPPTTLVIASIDWPAAAEHGAFLFAVEQFASEGLWVMPGDLMEALRQGERALRYEAEAMPTQVSQNDLDQSVVADALASGGAARRGWDELVLPGHKIALVFGPYVALAPGSYEVRFRLGGEAASSSGTTVDVTLDQGARVLASIEASNDSSAMDETGYRTLTLGFEIDSTVKGAEFRVFYSGGSELRVDYIESVRRLRQPRDEHDQVTTQ